MLLTITERLTLATVLPREGDIIQVFLMNELRDGIKLTVDEIEKYKIKPEGGQIRFEDDADIATNRTDISISPRQLAIVEESLRKLNDEKKLTAGHIGIYELFVGIPKDPDLEAIKTKTKKPEVLSVKNKKK